jgi:ABC-type Fe3+/spermidine/putrescine transport system ATPase subunit
MTEVVLDQLTRRYGEDIAVNALSLDVPSGELVALLGPSGCGKSTTLRMIAGLLPATSGEILFDGQPMTAVPAERRGAVMMFQNHRLFPHMTVAENVGFGLRMRGEDRSTMRRKVGEMLARVDLTGFENRRPDQLSGGQAQRVALARALVVGPRVLLLDEPLSNLDANLRHEMRLLIRRVHDELEITTLFVTHDQSEAVIVADRIALLFGGNLQQYAPPRDFFRRPANESTARFFGCNNFLPGIRRGDRVETATGVLRLDPSLPGEDGDVLVTVRPEAIRLPGPDQGCENHVPAEVVESIYQGVNTEVIVRLGGAIWRVLAGPECDLCPGQRVELSLPVAQVWVLRRD